MKAIQDTLAEKDKELNWTAILNYAREEIIAKSDQVDTVMNIVSQIPQNDNNDITIKKLQTEVDNLYIEYKAKK